MDGSVEVGCKMVGKLDGMIGELVGLGYRFVDFGQYKWVVPPFEKVFAWQKRPSSWWWVVNYLLGVAWKNS